MPPYGRPLLAKVITPLLTVITISSVIVLRGMLILLSSLIKSCLCFLGSSYELLDGDISLKVLQLF